MSKSNQPEESPSLVEPHGPARESRVLIEQSSWEGPLPHPDTLNKYDPETIREITAMAREEQRHRHGLLDKEQQEKSKVRNFSFALTLVSLVGGIGLVLLDKMFVFASVLIIVALGEFVSALLWTWTQKIRGKAKTTGQI